MVYIMNSTGKLDNQGISTNALTSKGNQSTNRLGCWSSTFPSSESDNYLHGDNEGDFCKDHLYKSSAIKSRKLRIPNTCLQFHHLLESVGEETQQAGNKATQQRPPRFTDLTYENSPPKRNKNFISKSCKLEKEKIDQDCNLPHISEDQVMPSLPIEILNKNEKLRKSSSYVFRQANRRDSVVAKEYLESERGESRRTSFAAPHKRRNSRYDVTRIPREGSARNSFEYVQDIFEDSFTVNGTFQAQRLETDGQMYTCISVDSIRRALCDLGITSTSATVQSLAGQQYLVFGCHDNQQAVPEDSGESD